MDEEKKEYKVGDRIPLDGKAKKLWSKVSTCNSAATKVQETVVGLFKEAERERCKFWSYIVKKHGLHGQNMKYDPMTEEIIIADPFEDESESHADYIRSLLVQIADLKLIIRDIRRDDKDTGEEEESEEGVH